MAALFLFVLLPLALLIYAAVRLEQRYQERKEREWW